MSEQTLLRCVHAAAHAVTLDARSDRELLDAFRSADDQSAFAALVRRHGPMVLAACHRVLRDPSAAEDAFQATFLALVRKADTIRDDHSIAGWLFRVARHVALEARRSDERRKLRERRYDVPASTEPADLSWREACALLHEELDRLPGSYRLPLLLCYLEGKTRDEAARHLGVSTGSVIGRLERGRKLLKRRLAQRGIALSAGLLAAVTDSATANGLPPHLTRSALAATQPGSVTPAVAALLDGVPNVTANNLKLLAGLAVAAGLVLAFGLATGRPNAAAAPPEKDARAVTWSGRVLDPEGKPLAGATLTHRGVTVATTDAEGRFRFDAVATRPGAERGNQLIASADGFAADWADLSGTGELTLRLVPKVPIRGRVLDLEGKPVVGATVTVVALETTPDGNLDSMFQAWRAMPIHPQIRMATKHLTTPTQLGYPAALRTDSEGRFELTAGRDRIVAVRITADTIEHAVVRIVARPGFDPKTDTPGPTPDPATYIRPHPKMVGPTFDFAARPNKPIVGTVRDAATGKPIAGVQVSGAVTSGWWENNVSATTNAEGRYRLDGLPKVKERKLMFYHGDRSPYIQAARVVGDTEGLGPITADAELVPGVRLSGRVTDKEGKPVPCALVYEPLAGNAVVEKLGPDSIYFHGTAAYRTDKDGRYQMTVPPGLGLVTVDTDDHRAPGASYTSAQVRDEDRKYLLREAFANSDAFAGAGGRLLPIMGRNAYKVIDVPADARTAECDITLDPGVAVTGKVIDLEGKPVSGAFAAGLTGGWNVPTKLSGDTFTARSLDDRPRSVAALDPVRKLAGTLTVSSATKGPVTLTLRPWGTLAGRLVDPDGNPLADVRVVPHFRNGSVAQAIHQWRTDLQGPVTDADGRFTLDGVFPDEPFGLLVAKKARHLDIGMRGQELTVKAGEVKDLGTLTAKPYPQ